MSDTSYLDDYLPTFPSITVLGVDTSEYDKYDQIIRRMLKVVASLPPARRAVFAAQVAAISEKFKAIDGSITSDDDKVLWTRHLKPLAAQAAKIIAAAKESAYQATTPGYAQQGPSAEDLAWSRLAENQPGYVPPQDMATPPDMSTAPDMAQAHADAGSTFLTRSEPPKAETPWPWWVWPIATVAAVALTGAAWRWLSSPARRVRQAEDVLRASEARFIAQQQKRGESGTVIKLSPEDLITGSSGPTRVPWQHLPLVPPEEPSLTDIAPPRRHLHIVDDKTPIDRPKKKK